MPGIVEDYIDIKSDYVPNYLQPVSTSIGVSRGYVHIENLELLDESIQNEYADLKVAISSEETVKMQKNNMPSKRTQS